MGAIGQLFSTLFSSLFAFFGKYVSSKVLISVSAVTAFVAIFAGLNSTFVLLLNSLSVALPSEFAWGLGIIPDNVPVCTTTIITARTAIWYASLKWSVVQIKLKGV